MKHVALCVFLGFSIILVAIPVLGAVIFEDDFESYDVGTYPDTGGWIMTWGGSGVDHQYVEDLFPHTGTQSLRLEGADGWSTASDLYVTIPDQAILRAYFYIHEMPQGDPSTGIGHIIFGNRDLGSWGTPFAGVSLTIAGNVQAYPGLFDIGTFQTQTWHKLVVIGDFVNNTFSIILDDEEILTDQPTGQATLPTDIRLCAGYGNNPNALIRFDDIIVEDLCIHNGDVNGDGSVTADDAQTTFLITLGLMTPTVDQECSADCDGNGTVTAGDAQEIFYEILSLGNCLD